MLDLKFIRNNQDLVAAAIRDKRVPLDLDQLLAADQTVLRLARSLQELQENRNENAKRMPTAAPDDRARLIEQGRAIAADIAAQKPRLEEAQAKLRELLLLVPGLPSPDAPRGATEADNVVVRSWGEPPRFAFRARDHVELLQRNGWYELERIAKVAGSRSYGLRGTAVLLEQSVLRLALDKLVTKSFTLMSVPSFAHEAAFVGTGHFPTGRDQVYFIEQESVALTGTSEVTLNALHSGEILSASDLPVRYAGLSSCFRREAGSAGKDVRGLIRVHQFSKVEQYVMCANDDVESESWHRQLLATSEEILQDLELPYRIVDCCTGDMGLGKYRMFDIETWVPSESKFRETHSCSNLRDWQARRADLRYRDKDGVVRYCHTLNNTAAATPRLLVPLLENHQQEDGTIRVPEKLRPYLGGRATLSS